MRWRTVAVYRKQGSWLVLQQGQAENPGQRHPLEIHREVPLSEILTWGNNAAAQVE